MASRAIFSLLGLALLSEGFVAEATPAISSEMEIVGKDCGWRRTTTRGPAPAEVYARYGTSVRFCTVGRCTPPSHLSDPAQLNLFEYGCDEPLAGRFQPTGRLCRGLPLLRWQGQPPRAPVYLTRGWYRPFLDLAWPRPPGCPVTRSLSERIASETTEHFRGRVNGQGLRWADAGRRMLALRARFVGLYREGAGARVIIGIDFPLRSVRPMPHTFSLAKLRYPQLAPARVILRRMTNISTLRAGRRLFCRVSAAWAMTLTLKASSVPLRGRFERVEYESEGPCKPRPRR